MRTLSALKLTLTCLFLAMSMGTAFGQPKKVTVRESFEPTFRIEPLVQRLTGRRSAVLPFEFDVEATNRDTEVEVALVTLRQEITGQVVHDEARELNESIKLLNPDAPNCHATCR